MKIEVKKLSYIFGLMLFSQIAMGTPVSQQTQPNPQLINPFIQATSTESELATPESPVIEQEQEPLRLKPIPPSLQSNIDSTGLSPGNPTRVETNNQSINLFSLFSRRSHDD